MRRIVAELDGEDGDGFAVVRLTDENGNDVTWLVDAGRRFADLAELEAVLAVETGQPVAVDED